MSFPISPITFRDRMEKHWVETLGNTSSDNLRAIWVQLGAAFGQAIVNHGGPDGRTWRVLQPPTGTGKTQGLCVYTAMVAKQNRKMDDKDKTGILIVTRLISQCDEIVGLINELAGTKVALVSHSKAKVSVWDINSTDILVVTHQAYINAVKGIEGEGSAKWSTFTNWGHGRRKLTVIDEALASMVEERQVTSSSVSQTLGFIPEDIKQSYPTQLSAIEMTADIFKQMTGSVQNRPDDGLTTTKMVWRGSMEMPQSFSMNDLRGDLWNHHYDQTVLGKESAADRHRLRDKVDDTLKGIEAVMDNWAYYVKKGDDHTLNFATLAIPEDIPGPVVLDATATQNFLWELFSDRSKVYEVPVNARSYTNVTLHVALSNGIGKGKMIEKHKERIPRLLENLEQHLSPDRSVFLCCHKGVEPFALGFEPNFKRYEVGHWGAVDGRNDWKDCDAVVLFGLSYRDPVWANNTFMAFQGRQEDEWIQDPTFKEYPDVRREMQDRQNAVAIIQAMNRVQCRKVVDEDGNCSPTDAFIVLPQDTTGDAILASINDEMPGIKIIPWNFVLDKATKKEPKIRKGSAHESIVAHMGNLSAGEYPVSRIKNDLDISDSVWKESVAKALRDTDHPFTKALAANNVSYVTGRGRGANSRLVKL